MLGQAETQRPGLVQQVPRTLPMPAHLQQRPLAVGEPGGERKCSPAMLTFVVAGGGFAGVETVGALNDFVREAVKSYPKLNPDWIRLLLVHPGTVVLPELGESLGL